VHIVQPVALTVQGPAARRETRVEASVGAAQVGAAQRGGDGTTTTLRSGDGAPQEAAEAGRGQLRDFTQQQLNIEMFKLVEPILVMLLLYLSLWKIIPQMNPFQFSNI